MTESKARTDKRQNPTSNEDESNLTILQAELKNLQLEEHPTPKQSRRMNELRSKIAQIQNSGNAGGNPNTQRRPPESRPWHKQ